MSRIGRHPVAIPAGVTVEIAEKNVVTVKGPKGTLVRELPVEMEIKKEGEEVIVTRPNDLKKMKSLHGLTRTLINNMVIGVTEGYEKVLEVFDQFEQTLGRQKILVEEYHDILLAGFAEIKAGVIPATSDCIIIGDMQRTRVEDIKVLFFLGLNEGNIPSQDTKVDLFNERERELLASEYEVELTPNVETKQSFQKFYFYLTLTKASEKLYLSYPEMDNQGGGLNPSSYLREIETLFPCLEEEYMETGQYYINDATMLNVFATELRKIKEEGITGTLKSVAGDLWSRRENRPIMEEMIDKAFFHYEPENIGASRARSLYGATIHTSPTRLEQEATCPFSQFLKYGIGLTERDVYEVSQKDIGSVYHMALEQFFKVTKTNNLNWVELTKEERSQYIDSCMENISENYKDSLFKSSAKNISFSSGFKYWRSSNLVSLFIASIVTGGTGRL